MTQLGDVDMEVADLVGLEPLRLLAVGFRQTRDSVTLQAAMQRRAREVRDDVLQRHEDVVQRQAGLTRSATIAASSMAERVELRRSFGPIGSSSTVRRDRHFLNVFSFSLKRRANSAPETCDRCSSARTTCVVLALPGRTCP